MITIGQLSQQSGVKVPTIRYYEKVGLIPPPPRSEGNQRRYTKSALKRLFFIHHSRQLGFSIDAIRELLQLSEQPEQNCDEVHAIASHHLEEVNQKVHKLSHLAKELERILACDTHRIETCDVIATLANHGLCKTEH